MDEKLKDKIEKLQALAERGIGGEKETAQRKIQQLLIKNGLTLDDLETEKKQFYLFSYNGKYKRKLLNQCIYKVMGASDNPSRYTVQGKRQKIGIYCTAAQKLEIELEYEFYNRLFDEEIFDFLDAFIDKQHIFPSDAPVKDVTELSPEELEKLKKQQLYEQGITKKTRYNMIGQKEAI